MITVLPGDDLTDYINTHGGATKDKPSKTNKHHPIKLGIGLVYHEKSSTIIATMAGRLGHNPSSNAFFIIANTKRYIPQINDRVIAIVEDRMGDYYRVTIPHTSHGSAILNITAFTGATKRNRPNLKRGDLIYGRICTDPSQHRHMEPEITCTVMPGEQQSGGGGAASKDWMTDEGTYGQLKGGGTCASISIGLARELLNPHNVVLEALGRCEIPFEICIGVNGVIWVNAPRPEYTILVLNAVQNSEVLTEDQVRGMVKRLVETIQSNKMLLQQQEEEEGDYHGGAGRGRHGRGDVSDNEEEEEDEEY